MLKLRIVMDNDKIQSEGKYDVSTVQSTLRQLFADNDLPQTENGDYIGRGRPDDYAKFWRIIWALAEKDWFMKNVSEWVWYNSDDGTDENDFATEDLLEFCKSRRIGASA